MAQRAPRSRGPKTSRLSRCCQAAALRRGLFGAASRLAARCLAALVSSASRGGTLRASRERLKVRAAALTGAGAEP
jgi:hypothetical protein